MIQLQEQPEHFPKQIIEKVDRLSSGQLDGLPFGAIQLDRNGQILKFNEYEANLSDRRAPETIGKNFFLEVAPCTNVREFHGRFQEGIERGDLYATFDYTFALKPRSRDVTVTLYYSSTTHTVWVFVQER